MPSQSSDVEHVGLDGQTGVEVGARDDRRGEQLQQRQQTAQGAHQGGVVGRLPGRVLPVDVGTVQAVVGHDLGNAASDVRATDAGGCGSPHELQVGAGQSAEHGDQHLGSGGVGAPDDVAQLVDGLAGAEAQAAAVVRGQGEGVADVGELAVRKLRRITGPVRQVADHPESHAKHASNQSVGTTLPPSRAATLARRSNPPWVVW